MKTKRMYMTLMLALVLNLSACGDSQEGRDSSENGTGIAVRLSEEGDPSENTINGSTINESTVNESG